jgi:NDP-sugar pyrophosphorylase family protein
MFENSSNKRTKFPVKDTERTRPALDLSRTVIKDIFTDRSRPWDVIPRISGYVKEHGDLLPHDEYDEISENVWVHVSAFLAPTARIEAPAIICGGAKISHFTYIENSVIGAFATVGEMTSVKNSILFDKSKLCGHNQLSFSILGYEAILGIGGMAPDVRLDGENVVFEMPEGLYFSGRSHLGAIICDQVKVGASAVINPGSIIDVGSQIFPLKAVSGYIYPYSTVK